MTSTVLPRVIQHRQDKEKRKPKKSKSLLLENIQQSDTELEPEDKKRRNGSKKRATAKYAKPPRKRAETNRAHEIEYRTLIAENEGTSVRIIVEVDSDRPTDVDVSVTLSDPAPQSQYYSELEFPPVLYIGKKEMLIGKQLEDLHPDLLKLSPRHKFLREILRGRLVFLSEQFSPCVWQLNERLIHERSSPEENEWCAEYIFYIQDRYHILPVMKILVQYHLTPRYRISWKKLSHFSPKYEHLVQLLDSIMRSVIQDH